MPLVDPVTMGSTIAKGANSQAQKATSSKTTTASSKDASSTQAQQLHPIQTKQTPLAQTARHALPALLGGLFVVRFRALVDDPVATMSSTLPLTAALQVAYAVTCLPVAGSQNTTGGSSGSARKGPRLGEKKRGAGEGAGPSRVAVRLFPLPFLPPSILSRLQKTNQPIYSPLSRPHSCPSS